MKKYIKLRTIKFDAVVPLSWLSLECTPENEPESSEENRVYLNRPGIENRSKYYVDDVEYVRLEKLLLSIDEEPQIKGELIDDPMHGMEVE